VRKIIGKVYLREGREERLFTKLECQDCGNVVFERKKAKIQKILADEVECIHCYRENHHYITHTDGGKERIDIVPRERPYFKRHFKSNDAAYVSWCSMKQRCLNPNHKSFQDYGGRGISIYPQWIDSFYEFWLYLGDRPPGTSIDRIDPDGNYEPGNVRWASSKEQNNNRRPYKTRCNQPVLDPETRRIHKKIYSKRYHREHYVPAEKSWWTLLGIKHNPYIYGPMPWKRGSFKYRRMEAIQRGWYVPPSQRIKKKF